MPTLLDVQLYVLPSREAIIFKSDGSYPRMYQTGKVNKIYCPWMFERYSDNIVKLTPTVSDPSTAGYINVI
jgi:hypothetical protein